MPTTSACPQASELQKLAAGRLPAEEMEALMQHLERCPICLANVQTLYPADTLANVLAKAAPPTYGSDEPIITRLIERLSKLGQTNGPADATPKMLTFACTGCGKNLKVKGELAGKKVKCPGCGKTTAAPPVQPLSEAKTMLPAADNSEQKTVLPSNGDTTNGATIDQPRKPEATQAFGGAGHVDEELWDFLAPAEQPDEIGRLGGYRVLKVLGAGGMGVVFRAEDPNLKRPVALKAMLPSLAASPSAKKRFMREARAAAALKHDHIVAIYQVGEDRGAPFLAMEFLDGEPLDKCLHRDTKLPLADVLRIGREIAEGLAAAHDKGLIHRDIKPANIWLEDRNPTSRARKEAAPENPLPYGRGSLTRVKILDFGLARAASEESGLTQQGAVLGTPAYMAPEQARGAPVDARCDLFSLGVVLYRMCTGKQPFLGNDTVSTLMAVATHEPPAPALVDPELPQELSDLVMKLLEKNLDQRLASANDAVEILQGIEKKLARHDDGRDATEAISAGAPKRVAATGAKKLSAVAATARKETPRRRLLPLLIVAGLLLVACLIGGGVLGIILIPTDGGNFAIETDDPNFSFKVHKGVVTLHDEKNKRTYKMKVISEEKGKFELEISEPANDLVFHAEKFTIKRGQQVALKAWFERKTPAVAGNQPLLDDAWLKHVAALPAKEQVKAVGDKLKELNLGFDGTVTPVIEGDVVTELSFSTSKVTDISPVRALTGLQKLQCNNGRLADLSPLKDMRLTHLVFYNTRVSDLTPLKDMKLTWLECYDTKVSDLSPLKEMKLTLLYASNTAVSDLTPLKNMPLKHLTFDRSAVSDLSPLKGMMLTELNIRETQVFDLAPLKGMPLTRLDCPLTRVFDLAPLKDMQLTYLDCGHTPISDLTPLKDMKLTHLHCSNTRVADLAPLKDMKLMLLDCSLTKVTDLSPLQGMPLKELDCDFKAERDGPGLRSITTLEKINGKDAKQFWQEVDAADRWVQLFNGKDLTGWHVESGAAGQWTVDAGAVVARSADWKTRNYLLSNKDYKDFILRLEFMTEPGGAGGAVLRAVDGEKMFPDAPCDHPVLKLTDPAKFADYSSGTTHWVRNDKEHTKPNEIINLPAGTWHTLEITVRGDQCTALLAGKKAVDIRLDSASGNSVVPGLKRAAGKVGFQANTGTVRYRNIEIKELSPAEFKSPPSGRYALKFKMNDSVQVPSLPYDKTADYTLEAYVTSTWRGAGLRYNWALGFERLALSEWVAVPAVLKQGPGWYFGIPSTGIAYATGPAPIQANRRIHLAGVRTGKTYRLFVDGKLIASKDFPTSGNSTEGFKIGKMFEGVVSEVRVSKTARYDKDFTPAQRFETDADTLALYHFDEVAGDVLKDSSGNNHHGKIVGAKWVNVDGAPIGPQAKQVAERGVLDYAEIHDADEKRFDAWIAQLPKDGFRPVSLSVHVMKDVPRYTAVAVKEEKKSVWEFRRPPLGKEIAQIEEMWAKNYSAFIQNPFNQEGKERAVVVWLWNATRTAMWTGDRVFIDIKIAEDAPNKVRPIYRSANELDGRINYAILLGPDDGTPMNDFINLPLDECKALIEKHKADGWRPKNLYTYGAGAKRLFGVTLVQEKDRPAWDISWSLTPAQYEAELIARKKQGYRPHASVGHEDDTGNVRFSVVWIFYRSENSPAPVPPPAKQIAEHGVHDYAEIHDADEKRFDAWIEQMKKDGFRPARLTVQTVKDAPRYTAVALKDDKNWPWEFSRANKGADNHADKHWKRKFEAVAHAFFRDKGKSREAFLWAKDESLDNDGYWLGDAPFIENKIKLARKEKARLISRCAGFEGNAAEFGIILESADGVPWQESYNLLFDDMKTYVEKHKADGWRPDHFCYYGVGAKRLFGAILIKDPNKADWDVSWSIAPAEYDKELSARKAQGFRPLTAVAHEDNAGALRFSVIWIRYRNLNARAARAPDMSKLKALHDDRFDNPKSGFPHDLKDPEYPAGYVNGKYSIKGGPNGYRSCGNQLYSNFACQVTGRLRNADSGRWGLNIFADGPRHGISVTINWDGKLSIKPEPADVVQDRGPKIGPIVHPAIKKGGEENTLLVIVRGREVEVYVNSILMCDPFVVDRDITPAWSSMCGFGGKGGVEAEFTRYTIWSAEGLPKVSAP